MTMVAIDSSIRELPGLRGRGWSRALLRSLILAMSIIVANAALAVSEGDQAPDFSLPVLGSGESKSLSESHGRVRYLDFWASWCVPCEKSVPEMIVLQRELQGRRFEIIAISVDERVDDALRFLDRHDVNYDNLSDPEGVTAKAYSLLGMPSSFVIDPEGRVTMTHTGFKPGDIRAIKAHILELLSQFPDDGS